MAVSLGYSGVVCGSQSYLDNSGQCVPFSYTNEPWILCTSLSCRRTSNSAELNQYLAGECGAGDQGVVPEF